MRSGLPPSRDDSARASSASSRSRSNGPDPEAPRRPTRRPNPRSRRPNDPEAPRNPARSSEATLPRPFTEPRPLCSCDHTADESGCTPRTVEVAPVPTSRPALPPSLRTCLLPAAPPVRFVRFRPASLERRPRVTDRFRTSRPDRASRKDPGRRSVEPCIRSRWVRPRTRARLGLAASSPRAKRFRLGVGTTTK
jgi:hypothetical protein